MDLGNLWFILIAVLFTGFFFLEGFDYGVGILLPILGKNDTERRIIINTIGPVWDANEVWLITAGGAIFAAFPNWYATMFSGFYLALLVVLSALIVRGVSFEFRSKKESTTWRSNWDMAVFICSLLLAVLWGVAFANLIKGVPIDKTMNYTGNFFDLISVYTLLGGITSLLIFTFHGAVFLTLKADETIAARAENIAKPLGIGAIVASILLVVMTGFETDLFSKGYTIVTAIVAVLLLALSCYMNISKKSKFAMISSGLSIALAVATLFMGLFPRVMVSSISADFSLTIAKASSSTNTLSLMTKVAFIFVPIVLAYQIWSYYIFRKRVTTKDLNY